MNNEKISDEALEAIREYNDKNKKSLKSYLDKKGHFKKYKKTRFRTSKGG